MKVVMKALGDQHRELDTILVALAEPDWERAVPDCPGWTVADVVLHLAQTDELVSAGVGEGFTAAAERLAGGPRDHGTVDDLIARMVANERGASAADVLARWQSAAGAVRSLLADCDPRRPLPWAVTDLPARTLAITRLAECWIHTRDIARAVGGRRFGRRPALAYRPAGVAHAPLRLRSRRVRTAPRPGGRLVIRAGRAPGPSATSRSRPRR